VGLFKRKSPLTSDFDIISSIFQELVKGLLTIIQQELITEKESELYWAFITSASSRFMASPEEDEAIQSIIVNLIKDAIALKVKNPDTDPRILEAYNNRKNVPQVHALYLDLPENFQTTSRQVQTSLNNELLKLSLRMPENPYLGAVQVSMPVFTHYLEDSASRLSVDPDDKNINALATMLTIAFSLSFENSIKLTPLESEESTDKRLIKTKSICSYMVTIWAFHEAVMRIENKSGQK
jgi:hypothetical protein